jgi:SAM-dependent methyltransferase
MIDNTEQRDFWTDDAGPIWVAQRAGMDALFSGVLETTLRRANLEAGQSVLDIGCGAGSSTLAVADLVGDSGYVTGIDISRTLLDDARGRAMGRTNVAFLEADAQTHPLVPQSADAIVSRFGVMFFEDSVAAFCNMATAFRAGGTLSFSAWGAIGENPFFTLPARIARQILGPIPKSDPDAPGPFAFRDPDRITSVLTAAGLSPQIDVREELLICPQGPQALARIMCQIGPAHSALLYHKADIAAQTVLMEALVDALCAYQTEDGIAIPAQINYVTARKSA